MKEINEWVRLETKNRIKNTVDANALDDPNTALVLINVVYFNGKWRNKFDGSNPEEFTNLDGEKKLVDMMYCKEDYMYGQFRQYRIVELDYFGDSSMYVVLPNKKVNLDDLLLGLNAQKLNDDLRQLKSTYLKLKLPKFKLESDINWEGLLKQLGVETLFDDERADLSRTWDGDGLCVSKFVQKCYISVDEKGTEAAAATFVLECDSMREPKKDLEFYVNRPFVFIIRLNGVNIFVGSIKKLSEVYGKEYQKQAAAVEQTTVRDFGSLVNWVANRFSRLSSAAERFMREDLETAE